MDSILSSLYTQNGHSTSIRRAYRREANVLGTIHESSTVVQRFGISFLLGRDHRRIHGSDEGAETIATSARCT